MIQGKRRAACRTVGIQILLAALLAGSGHADPKPPAAGASTIAAEPTATAGDAAIDFDAVTERARTLATSSFEEPVRIPDWLLEISYDQWRDIRFKPDASLWRSASSQFEVQLFHPGLFYDRAVPISVIDAEGARPVEFSPGLFNYGDNNFGSRVPADLGFAGLRLHYPINRADYRDEVIVFLGASYFRALGKDMGFGISARGLAVDTALPSGEEFPFFKELWLVRPTAKAKAVTVLALLDSPRITGALEFTVTPGTQTTTDVRAVFFPRAEIEKIGLAPLTSMFLRGENSLGARADYRPEVHDSDGLAIQAGDGEWIWRPLENPEELRAIAFAVTNPKGFGLFQRDRAFDNYQDLETHPEKRPGVWVEPKGDWGRGHIELIEIPTRDDTNDNIVAFFVPERPVTASEPISISYRLSWFADDPSRPPGGRVVATRRDAGTLDGVQRFVIDFAGAHLKELPAKTLVHGDVTVGTGDGAQGEVVDQQVIKNSAIGGWRLIFQVRPRGRDPIDLRAFLQLDQTVLTETWSYVIDP